MNPQNVLEWLHVAEENVWITTTIKTKIKGRHACILNYSQTTLYRASKKHLFLSIVRISTTF